MKFSERWLREWVDPPVSTDVLVEQLTMAGLEVDSVEPAAPAFEKVIVAEVVAVEPHPDADKLRVCRVSTGSETLQVVCGAPNVHAGMKAPLAMVGGCMPGDFRIKKARLRGVESFGMLCSARELGLSEDHAGLMSLPADAPVGEDIRDYLALDDMLIDVDLTPNRGDCLGMEGIAREVGVLNRATVSPPEIAAVAATTDAVFPVEVLDGKACPRYLGRVIRGVDVSVPAPQWMQERLRRGGIRSINAVVDITNYVLLELGQPMHAFDLERLRGGIRVRPAGEGEKLVLLDGSEIALQTDTLVIADHERPLALAGIMGGEDSGISDNTGTLFLECAYFAPRAIAGRARKYGLQTDSSYRFERGVDPALQGRAMERATALVLDILGGEAGPVIDVTTTTALATRPEIELRNARIARLLGVDLPAAEVEDILTRLGMRLDATADGWKVVAPGFRFDIGIEADLIEEIGRVYGYNRLPVAKPQGEMVMAPVSETRLGLDRIRALLVDRDYQEAITYSFVDPALQEKLDPDHDGIGLANPLSSEMAVMRTSLWPGLVQALRHNLHRQQSRVRLFEQGLRFVQAGDELLQEPVVAGVATGSRDPEQWAADTRPLDFFDAKGDVEALVGLARGVDVRFEQGAHPALHPGQCARVVVDGSAVGWVGCLHPRLAVDLDVPENTYLFELCQDTIQAATVPAFAPISKFPSIRRDLALVVDRATSAAQIREEIRRAAGDMMQDIVLFDVYEGERIETGRKSLALGLILQDSSRTLTDNDVNDVVSRVTHHLKQQLGAQLRD